MIRRLGVTATSLVKRSTQFSALQLQRGGGGHHYKGYNEPTGNLFGIPPAPPGYRRQRYDFEYWSWIFGATWVGFFVLMYYRPEDEIDAWAREEAMRRIKASGVNWDTPDRPY